LVSLLFTGYETVWKEAYEVLTERLSLSSAVQSLVSNQSLESKSNL